MKCLEHKEHNVLVDEILLRYKCVICESNKYSSTLKHDPTFEQEVQLVVEPDVS